MSSFRISKFTHCASRVYYLNQDEMPAVPAAQMRETKIRVGKLADQLLDAKAESNKLKAHVQQVLATPSSEQALKQLEALESENAALEAQVSLLSGSKQEKMDEKQQAKIKTDYANGIILSISVQKCNTAINVLIGS